MMNRYSDNFGIIRWPIGGYFVLTLTLSFAIFGILGGVFTHLKVGIDQWQGLLGFSLSLGLAASTVLVRLWCCPREEVEQVENRKHAITFTKILRFSPYLLLVPSVLVVLLSVRLQISNHGFFHSAYVYQIISGVGPPENVTLPGYPANFYWLYSALVGAISDLFVLAPPVVSTGINIAVLVVTLYWARCLVAGLLPSRKDSVLVEVLALFVLFGANLLGVAQSLLGQTLLGYFTLFNTQPIMLFGDSRMRNLLPKFMNFNGFPIGIMLYVAVLVLTAMILRRQRRHHHVTVIISLTLGAVAVHPTTGIFILVVIPLALVAVAVSNILMTLEPNKGIRTSGNVKQSLLTSKRHVIKPKCVVLAWLILLISIPLFLFLLGSARAMSERASFSMEAGMVASVLAVVYPIVPLFAVGVVKAVKENRQDILFLAYVCVLGLMLACLIQLPGGNEYKFVLLSTIPMCAVSVIGLQALLKRARKGNGIARLLIIGIFALLFLNIAFIGLSQFDSGFFRDDSFSYEGIDVVTERAEETQLYADLQFSDVYMWIRSNTLSNSVIVVPYAHKDMSTLYVLSRRLPYVVYGAEFNRGFPEYEERKRLVNELYSDSPTIDERAKSIDSLYRSLPGREILIVAPHDCCPKDTFANAGLQKLFSGASADLYKRGPKRPM